MVREAAAEVQSHVSSVGPGEEEEEEGKEDDREGGGGSEVVSPTEANRKS